MTRWKYLLLDQNRTNMLLENFSITRYSSYGYDIVFVAIDVLIDINFVSFILSLKLAESTGNEHNKQTYRSLENEFTYLCMKKRKTECISVDCHCSVIS